jgi:hypothetical protein
MSDDPLTPPIAPPTAPESPEESDREVALDNLGRIAESVECRQCGYNLQGLIPSTNCPECAMPIVRSIRGDELRFSDPGWVRILAQGAQVILIGIFTVLAGGLLFGAGVAIYAVTLRGAINPNAIITAASFLALPMVIIIAGVWRLTTPDPGQLETEPTITARKLARWCVLLSLFAIPMQMMGGNPGIVISPNSNIPTPSLTFQILTILAQNISVVGFVAGLLHLSRLAKRIPNPSLTKQSLIVMWGYGILSGLGLLLSIGALLLLPMIMRRVAGANNPPAGTMVMAGGGGSSVGCFMFVFYIWTIVILFRFRNAFRKESETALTNWQA